jgi:type IV secretory pathway VirB3-like protein
MSGKLLWVGLTFVVGLPAILPVLNLASAVPVFVILGGLLMLIGAVLLVLDR